MSETTAFTVEQLDAWQKAFESGAERLAAAREADSAARQAEQRKLLHAAAEGYERAAEAYRAAIELLALPAGLELDHVAIRQMSDQARAERSKAIARGEELTRENPAARCREQQHHANQLLVEAEAALARDDSAEARSKADEARLLDPTLGERVEELIRGIEAAQGGESNRSGLIVAALAVGALIGLGVFLGPPLWAWASEFLFPAMLIVKLMA